MYYVGMDIFSRVEVTGFCWLWTGALYKGYGRCVFEGRNQGAHRVIYKLLVGEILDGLELDHLCNIRNCVNPDHLEPVTPEENKRRSIVRRGLTLGVRRNLREKARLNAERVLKGLCKHGHVLAEVGQYVQNSNDGPQVVCKMCRSRTKCNYFHPKVGCPRSCPLQTYPRQC